MRRAQGIGVVILLGATTVAALLVAQVPSIVAGAILRPARLPLSEPPPADCLSREFQGAGVTPNTAEGAKQIGRGDIGPGFKEMFAGIGHTIGGRQPAPEAIETRT